MANDKEKSPSIVLPEGRLINGSLFVKDAFKGKNDEPTTPKYKIEVAFDKDDKAFDKIIAAVEEAAKNKYGKNSILDIDARQDDPEDDIVISGILDGDVLARKREKKGKEGDAYKNKWVIRASTIFNLHGEDGPGGIEVFDEAVEPITPVDKSLVYNGCYICAKTNLGFYQESKTDANAINWFLKAVQKVGDGDRLTASQDNASAFEKRAGSSRRRGSDEETPRGRSRDREEPPARGRDREEPPARRSRGDEEEAPRGRSRDREEPEERSTSRRR